MKIGIDARMLGVGFGLARYVQQLVLNLDVLPTTDTFVLFLRKQNWDSVQFIEECVLTEKQPDTIYVHKNKCIKVLADIPWYTMQEQVQFAHIIKKQQIDLMHFPHWNVPLMYGDPFVVTIHDLIMYHYARPQATTLGPLKFWLTDKAHRLVVSHAVKKAKEIIVTSEFTKQDVHHTLSVPLKDMTVTYQAPYPILSSLVDANELLKTLGITKPFVMTVGSAYPHKHLEGLVQAWQVFEERYGTDYQLVFVGKDSYFYDQLKQSKVVAGLKTPPVFTGFLSDQDLSLLYKKAKLYVFPSLYEGFGLPPLEAMAHGLPVVSSNRSCLPEVLGEAVLYVDSEQTVQMAEALHTALTNLDLRYQLTQAGYQEIKRYSWKHLALQTLEIYKKNAT